MDRQQWRRGVGLIGLMLVGLMAMSGVRPGQADTAGSLVVNKTADTDDGSCDGDCSLREAMTVANGTAGADTISFALPISSTIILSGTQLPVITDTVTIDGGTAVSLTISGNQASRVFEIGASTAVTMSQLAIRDGWVQAATGEAVGGGIWNQGVLTLLQVQVVHNEVRGADGAFPGGLGEDAYGGGIYNGCTEAGCGLLIARNSAIESNTTSGGRGGDGSGDIHSGNGGQGLAGGLYNGGGGVWLEDTSLTANSAFGGDGGNGKGGEYSGGNGGQARAGGLFNGCGQPGCGSVNMTRVTIQDNYADGGAPGLPCAFEGPSEASGIYNLGTIWGNQVDISGHGVGWAYDSCFTYGGSGGGAGGVLQLGSLFLSNSTIYNNSSYGGGGLLLGYGTVTEINNSTISSNFGLSGGGILIGAGANLVLNYVTIVNNRAGSIDHRHQGHGGGIYSYQGTITVRNSILADNDALSYDPNHDYGDDCVGVLISLGYNLLTDSNHCSFVGDTTGNILEQPVLLHPLQDNGGFTPTHALWPMSPAVDGANPADCPKTDQRGEIRPQDGDGDGTAVCDMGAFEGFVLPANQFYLPVATNH